MRISLSRMTPGQIFQGADLSKEEIKELKKIRVHSGLSQTDMAELFDVTKITYLRWERFRCVPYDHNKNKIKKLLKIYTGTGVKIYESKKVSGTKQT